MARIRWRSSIALWVGLSVVALGLLGSVLVSTAPYGPSNRGSEVVAFELWLSVVAVVLGLVIITTWGAHRWCSRRQLSEELGITPPHIREAPWLKDVIDRRGPPPSS